MGGVRMADVAIGMVSRSLLRALAIVTARFVVIVLVMAEVSLSGGLRLVQAIGSHRRSGPLQRNDEKKDEQEAATHGRDCRDTSRRCHRGGLRGILNVVASKPNYELATISPRGRRVDSSAMNYSRFTQSR